MSNLISGLSIDITLNSLKLEKGLRSVRQHLRATQSEANASFQEWKHGEKSLNSYNRVVESSTKHIDAQKKTLEELKKRQTELTNARNDSLDADGNATKETKKLNDELIRNAREISEVENKLGFHERQLAKVKEEYKAFVKEQELANNKWNIFGKKIEESGKKLTNFGNKMQSLGGNLTNKITKPALGATTAIAGMFTGLGVKRLVAIDEANAKMRGLGHDAEKYAETVSNAVDGTLLTYAEGMDITAGALSAGVKEGKELEKYIRLVGNASAGSGRQASETAQIFNRVVGGGKLMTQELNMIEDGMPGFSKEMAKHLGVPQEEFRKMVTEGKVSSDDFLTVMDDFSGELSKEMAKTFPGLVKNTFSRIGKLGEVFWSGTYDKLKDQLAKFAELLTSDELKKTFAEWGKKFADFVEKIINGIYKLIKWWTSLSDTTKKIIGILGLVTVAIGPVILMVGKFITTIGTIMTVVGPVMSGIAKLGGVIGILTNPITLAIAGITALVTGFVLAYKKIEPFKNLIDGIIEKIIKFKDKITDVINKLIAIIGSFKRILTGESKDYTEWVFLQSLGISPELADKLTEFANKLKEKLDLITGVISGFINAFKNSGDESEQNIIKKHLKSLGVSEKVAEFVVSFGDNLKKSFDKISGIITSFKNIITGESKDYDEWVFLQSLGISPKLADKLTNIATTIKEKLDLIKDVVENVKKSFTSDEMSLLEALGFSDSQIEMIQKFVDLLVDKFNTIKSAFDEVMSFVKSLFNDFKTWWDSDGAMIIESIGIVFDKIFIFIKDLTQRVFGIIEGIFATVLPLLLTVWTENWDAIKLGTFIVWEAIKLFIGTVMDLIQGIISTVSAIIQGDWSRAWEIIKETAFSILGRLWEFISNVFFKIKDYVVTKTEEMKTKFKEKLAEMLTQTISKFLGIYNSAKEKVTNMKNTVVNYITDMKNATIQRLRDMLNGTINKFSDMYTTAKNKARDMKNKVVDFFIEMKDKALKQFKEMVDGAKALPGKIKKAIIDGKSKAVEGIKSLGNSMVDKLGEVVNGVIGGINKVMEKIGIDKSISEWPVPSFSTGTQQGSPSRKFVRNGRIAEDTMALVGDRGPGNGKGTREIVEFPNGKVGLFDNNQTIFAPKGTRIFNNRQTEDILANIPRFSIGTWVKDKYQKGKNKVKSGINWASNKVTDLLDAPRTVFNSIVSSFYDGFSGFKGFAKDLGKGMWNQAKSGLYSWLKGRFSEAGEGRKQNFMDFPMTTIYSPNRPIPGYPFNGGRHWGIDYGTPSNTNITAPSAGTVTRQSDYGGGIVARLKQANGFVQYFLHMNSVSTGRKKAGDSVGKSGNTGRYTTGPHLHWQVEKGTNFLQNRNTVNPLSIIKKHALGGIINREGLYLLGENDKEEVVIPMERQNEAMKLVTYVAEKLKSSNSTQTKHIPNIPTSRNQNKDTSQDEQVELLKQQINELKKSNELLMSISEKTIDVSLSAKEVASKTYKEVNRLIESDKNRRARLV